MNNDKKKFYNAQYRTENKEKIRSSNVEYRRKNKDIIREKQKKYYSQNKEKIILREYQNDIIKNYGIDINDYEKIFKDQEERCAICGIALKQLNHRVLFIDHDHVSGSIRGLLCSNCNKGIGLFKDDIKILENAINYLSRQFLQVESRTPRA
jgi:hypothetical protein